MTWSPSQTAATNEPALALYASLGFQPVEQATCFRLAVPMLGFGGCNSCVALLEQVEVSWQDAH